jgi:CP family cyanate transporter-like MFS transporter
VSKEESSPISASTRWYLVAALFLVGANLRPALSSVASVLAAIRGSTGLSGAGAGLLTTLPVLCFGVFAPLAPSLASRFGADRTVLFGLVALAAALGARVFFGIPGLFLGTLVVGASIGVVMVLLPGIIKREFGRHAGSMMGMYSMALCLGAAAAAGTTVPLVHAGGGSWRVALAFWLLPVLAAAALWWPRLRHAEHHSNMRRYTVQGLWANLLAWQVTAFMGLQSALAYCVFGWLPTILIDRGMTPLAAGGVLSLSIGLQLITALGGPWIAGLARDQRMAIVAMMLLTLVGFAGCLYADIDAIWWWAVVLGLGQGGAFSIGLTLIVLRAPNATVAASLSGMVQGVGYLVAALGPLAFGLLRDLTHDWNAAAILFIAVSLAALVAGLGAGRDQHVAVPVTEVQ